MIPFSSLEVSEDDILLASQDSNSATKNWLIKTKIRLFIIKTY